MVLPMRSYLRAGNKFPNFELPDHNGEIQSLTQILWGYPGVVVFSRGSFCPKDRRQLQNYVEYLQPELEVNYCKLMVVSVEDQALSAKTRAGLGATFPFLSDADRKLLHELEMVDVTDKEHGEIYIPYTFIVDRERTIYKVYNGWWYVGRPTVEEIRMDLRALMSRRKDWIYPGSGRPGHTVSGQ